MIVNFFLSKILVEKSKEVTGNIEAKNSVRFLDVSKERVVLGEEKKDFLSVKFQFKVDYSPGVAVMEMDGVVHVMLPEGDMKKVLTMWEKEQKMGGDLSSRLINHVYMKCGVKALSLSQEVNLPPHIPLPRIGLKPVNERGAQKPRAS